MQNSSVRQIGLDPYFGFHNNISYSVHRPTVQSVAGQQNGRFAYLAEEARCTAQKLYHTIATHWNRKKVSSKWFEYHIAAKSIGGTNRFGTITRLYLEWTTVDCYTAIECQQVSWLARIHSNDTLHICRGIASVSFICHTNIHFASILCKSH